MGTIPRYGLLGLALGLRQPLGLVAQLLSLSLNSPV